MKSHVRDVDDVTLDQKVEFLRQARSYSPPPRTIETIETHMSWVFLTERHAYKLKKPVVYEFLDFSTPEKRLLDCREEVRLNRRLAPEVYLGVVTLIVDADGSLELEGDGRAVDWLVKMKRLPGSQMLDQAIRHKSWEVGDLNAISELLIDFYTKAIPADISPAEYKDRLKSDIQSTFRELRGSRSTLSKVELDAAERAMLWFLDYKFTLLKKRVEEARIVEGHGDLRPEHICLRNPPSIIDCLEFSRDLRLMDSCEELAFLHIECEHLGDPTAAQIVAKNCFDALQDHPPSELFHFFAARRASVRAKLCVRHLEEPEFHEEDEKWIKKAAEYLSLAHEHAAACYSPSRS